MRCDADQVVDNKDHQAWRYDARAELRGPNHSDNTLVMRLPKEKLIFTVDLIPIEGSQLRGMPE